jgi:hypothetical protein
LEPTKEIPNSGKGERTVVAKRRIVIKEKNQYGIVWQIVN